MGWIVQKKVKKNHKKYIVYDYLSNAKDKSLIFPRPTVSATYELRLFIQGYVPTSKSSLILNGEDRINLSLQDTTITVETNLRTIDPTTEKVWIGIYHTSEERPRYYRRYKYLSSQNEILTFKRLIHDGEYEARLLQNNDYEVRCKSQSVPILTSTPSSLVIDRATVGLVSFLFGDKIICCLKSEKPVDLYLLKCIILKEGQLIASQKFNDISIKDESRQYEGIVNIELENNGILPTIIVCLKDKYENINYLSGKGTLVD